MFHAKPSMNAIVVQLLVDLSCARSSKEEIVNREGKKVLRIGRNIFVDQKNKSLSKCDACPRCFRVVIEVGSQFVARQKVASENAKKCSGIHESL
jgi:hypothetical protein